MLKFRRAAFPVVAVCALLAIAARAQTVAFPDFTSTTGLRFNSSSVTGGVAVLADNGHDRGSLFTTSQFNVTGFSARFQFWISNPSGIPDSTGVIGADGLAFVIQRDARGDGALGGFGSGLGYSGITNSIAVEFDTFSNSFDPSSNHIGIDTGGSATSLAVLDMSGSNFDNGSVWTVWVDYNGTNLEVRANTTGLRPATADLAYAIDVAGTIGGGTAHLGFTGATGSGYGDHQLISFTFSDTYLVNGIAAVPEPSTFALCAIGLGLLGIAFRRRRLTS